MARRKSLSDVSAEKFRIFLMFGYWAFQKKFIMYRKDWLEISGLDLSKP